jgi:hypothetical protein
MRFCIRLRSALSEILVQSLLGFVEADKAEDVCEYLLVLGAVLAAGMIAEDLGSIHKGMDED